MFATPYQSYDSQQPYQDGVRQTQPQTTQGYHEPEIYDRVDSRETITNTEQEYLVDSETHTPKQQFTFDQPTTVREQHKGSQRAGLLRNIPATGLLAIFGVIICAIAAGTILSVSDGRQIGGSWYIQPAVWLAVLSAIANALIQYALSQGSVVRWWRQAVRGDTLNSLYQHWSYSGSVVAALASGKHFNLVALACIMSTLMLINGPLLQRASVVVSSKSITQRVSTINIAQELPLWYTGFNTGRTTQATALQPAFGAVLLAYLSRSVLPSNLSCTGTCFAKVRGTGLYPSCSTVSSAINNGDRVMDSNNGSFLPSSFLPATVFSVEFRLNEPNRGLTLNSSYTIAENYRDSLNCPSETFRTICDLRPAIIEYPIRFTNKTMELLDMNPFPSLVEMTTPSNASHFLYSTYGGLYLALDSQFSSLTTIRFIGRFGWDIVSFGTLSYQYFAQNQSNLPGIAQSCNVTFTDPTSQVLTAVHELMFRTALSAANSSMAQQVNATQITPVTVFKTEYRFLAGAGAVMGLAALAVLLIFNGWWLLGRNVTLSPLEIVRSFRGPLLLNTSTEHEKLLEQVGHARVRYEDPYGFVHEG